MNFEFFEGLSKSDAELFLANFLSVESGAVDGMLALAASEGVTLPGGSRSIEPLFLWISAKLKSVPEAPDVTLPDWVTETSSYKRGLYEFDEASRVLILRAAYFFGATFVKEFPHLRWATGDRETMLQNMPVINGFKDGIEMPPIMVTENIMRDIYEGSSSQIIDRAIKGWIAKV